MGAKLDPDEAVVVMGASGLTSWCLSRDGEDVANEDVAREDVCASLGCADLVWVGSLTGEEDDLAEYQCWSILDAIDAARSRSLANVDEAVVLGRGGGVGSVAGGSTLSTGSFDASALEELAADGDGAEGEGMALKGSGEVPSSSAKATLMDAAANSATPPFPPTSFLTSSKSPATWCASEFTARFAADRLNTSVASRFVLNASSHA